MRTYRLTRKSESEVRETIKKTKNGNAPDWITSDKETVVTEFTTDNLKKGLL